MLNRWTERVEQAGGDYAAASAQWAIAAAPKKHVKRLLGQMAYGAERCMYCEDNLGTDIDHVQPLAVAPLRAFDWLNHLLACSYCNSHTKGRQYPCDADGRSLLIDPSTEDPADHLVLRLAASVYDPLSDKGRETIWVFRLNRGDLVQGRRLAFVTAQSLLVEWQRTRQAHNTAREKDLVEALTQTPFADVVQTMCVCHSQLRLLCRQLPSQPR
ncbi:HNH endonuclease [Streptomyces sp. NPDC127077]|uniref:HNH endonuclease n=1 Tax=Streptomyces sp. NPDC127077 TaxID=3347131 RepID=UPI0036609E1C